MSRFVPAFSLLRQSVLYAAELALSSAGTPPAGAEGARRLRILLAEDNPINRRLAERLLEKREHQITIAFNGREAVRHFETGEFDVVLMDVQMPELDGYGATAAIRKLEASRGTHVPIIGVTAHALKGDRERCLAAGMDGYVAKPILPKVLYAEIDRVTNKSEEPKPALSQLQIALVRS